MAAGACRFLTWNTATFLAQGGRLSAQRLDQPEDIPNQRPSPGATGRDRGLWAAIFAANTPLSRFGEGQLRDRILLGVSEINDAPVVHRWKKFDALLT